MWLSAPVGIPWMWCITSDCDSLIERGDGFSDLKVQSVAVQSCFTNNRSQQ